MVFENKSEPIDSDRYRVEVHFSPGVKSRKRLLKGEPISENVSLTKLKKMSLIDTPLTGGGGNNSQPLRRRSAQSSAAAGGIAYVHVHVHVHIHVHVHVHVHIHVYVHMHSWS